MVNVTLFYIRQVKYKLAFEKCKNFNIVPEKEEVVIKVFKHSGLTRDIKNVRYIIL